MIIAGSATLVLLALLMVMWQRHSQNNGHAHAMNSASSPMSSVDSGKSAGAFAKSQSSEPLPPLDKSLPTIIDALRRRALNGDASAACRLAAEYAECDQLRLRRADVSRWLAERQRALDLITDSGVKQQAADHIEREMALRNNSLETLANHCGRIDIPKAAQLANIWRDAALRGSPAAMRQYVSGNAFRWNSIIEVLPMLTTYKREAEGMAKDLASQGDIGTILALAAGYNPASFAERSLLAQTLNPDAARSLALYERAKQTIDGDRSGKYSALAQDINATTAELRASMSQDELADSARLSKEEMASWQPPVIRSTEQRISAAGRQNDIDRAACDPISAATQNPDAE